MKLCAMISSTGSGCGTAHMLSMTYIMARGHCQMVRHAGGCTPGVCACTTGRCSSALSGTRALWWWSAAATCLVSPVTVTVSTLVFCVLISRPFPPLCCVYAMGAREPGWCAGGVPALQDFAACLCCWCKVTGVRVRCMRCLLHVPRRCPAARGVRQAVRGCQPVGVGSTATQVP